MKVCQHYTIAYWSLLSCNTVVFHITSCLCGKYPYRTEIEWNKLAFIKWRRQKACISPFKVVLVAELTNSVFWDTSLDFKHLQYKQSRLTLPETNNLLFSSLKMIETLKKYSYARVQISWQGLLYFNFKVPVRFSCQSTCRQSVQQHVKLMEETKHICPFRLQHTGVRVRETKNRHVFQFCPNVKVCKIVRAVVTVL